MRIDEINYLCKLRDTLEEELLVVKDRLQKAMKAEGVERLKSGSQ